MKVISIVACLGACLVILVICVPVQIWLTARLQKRLDEAKKNFDLSESRLNDLRDKLR